MDLATLIAKALAIVTAVRAAASWMDYVAIAPQILDLIKIILSTLPGPAPGPVMMASSGDPVEDCCKAIEDLCVKHAPAHATPSSAALPTGPFVTALAAMLLKLLQSLFTK